MVRSNDPEEQKKIEDDRKWGFLLTATILIGVGSMILLVMGVTYLVKQYKSGTSGGLTEAETNALFERLYNN